MIKRWVIFNKVEDENTDLKIQYSLQELTVVIFAFRMSLIALV